MEQRKRKELKREGKEAEETSRRLQSSQSGFWLPGAHAALWSSPGDVHVPSDVRVATTGMEAAGCAAHFSSIPVDFGG